MDLIGFTEKLRYDKIHKSNIPSQRVDMYIDAIRYAFGVKYGKFMYKRIERFRREYLQLTSPGMHSSDEIMSKQTYNRYMEILHLAEEEKLFDCS